MYKTFILFTLFVCELCTAAPSDQKAENEYLLQQAKYFLSSDPIQTLHILDANLDLAQLTQPQQILWHMINTRASTNTNQLTRAGASIEYLLSHPTRPFFLKKRVAILRMVGIWLRKSSYFKEAELTFHCALKQPSSSVQRIGLTISSAIIARRQEHYRRAKTLYLEALDIAKKLDKKSAVATITNNLGVLALDNGNLEQANAYFRLALAGHQLQGKKPGHINSGINLLFVFLLQKQFVNYQRLYEPIAQLVNELPDKPKRIYLFWVNSTYKFEQGEKINQATKEQLISQFYQLESRGLKALIKQHLASRLNLSVTLPAKVPNKVFTAPWFDTVKSCTW